MTHMHWCVRPPKHCPLHKIKTLRPTSTTSRTRVNEGLTCLTPSLALQLLDVEGELLIHARPPHHTLLVLPVLMRVSCRFMFDGIKDASWHCRVRLLTALLERAACMMTPGIAFASSLPCLMFVAHLRNCIEQPLMVVHSNCDILSSTRFGKVCLHKLASMQHRHRYK